MALLSFFASTSCSVPSGFLTAIITPVISSPEYVTLWTLKEYSSPLVNVTPPPNVLLLSVLIIFLCPSMVCPLQSRVIPLLLRSKPTLSVQCKSEFKIQFSVTVSPQVNIILFAPTQP